MRAWLLCMPFLVGCASNHSTNHSTAKPQDPETPHPVGVGDRAPDVAPGKVTLVVFSATWSEPSKKLDMRIEEIWRARQGKPFVIRAILVDDEPDALEGWRKTYGFTYPFEWDRDRRLATRYGISTDAVVFVVDRAGVVRHVHVGHHDGDELLIASELDALVAH